MKKFNILQSNPKKKYEGSHYAISGFGGFGINTEREIIMKQIPQFGKYDLTNALQIVMDKEIFNSKIGVFDSYSQRFPNDSIFLDTNEFLLNENQIISLGILEIIYIDFKKCIYDYFNLSPSIKLFNEYIPNIFDESELCNMMRTNEYTGYIQLTGINEIIRNLVNHNICGNRTQYGEIKDGFMDGDIFYISEGLNIVLFVDCGLKKIYKYDISIRLK
jgi:hypothetical protein